MSKELMSKELKKGARILLTGVTGFVGKVVLEELSRRRVALGVEQVYVLIRQGRKGAGAEERFRQEVVSSECFARQPQGWDRFVTVVPGDLTKLELEPAMLAELHDKLTHVIHCAASVAFDLPVKEAAEANITSALGMLELARGCKHLQAFVDVSTAYVSPHPGQDVPIPEDLVRLPMDPEEVYRGILDGTLEEKALLQRMGHPNTYTLTKCLSEHLLTRRKGEVPLRIVRPSIIASSWQYPRPGWIDSYAAFAGFVGLIGAGVLKCAVAREDTVLDIVPCDEVAHRIIETAFASEVQPIQHIVTGVDRGSRVDTCIAGIESYFQRHPVQFWPGIAHISNGGPKDLPHWLYHTLPALLTKTWLGLTGKPRKLKQIQKVEDKINYVNAAFIYFTHHTFRFEVARPIEQVGFEPKQFIERICRGVHHNLMQADPAETLLGGSEHRYPLTDLLWVNRQPRGNWAIRTAAYVVRKGLRRCNDRITFDRDSFERAMDQVPPESLRILVPSHRSYMDFLLCSYLVFAHPELNIPIPRIAAASDFARLPLLGWFFQQTHAFYIQRGQGKADPELTRKIQQLVQQNQALEFFVEGTRSRARQFLAPRRGMLRALQGTGVDCTLLPIAISYDLVPEEKSFLQELRGTGNSKMKMSSLLRWTIRLLSGKVRLGRIHLVCGRPLPMNTDSDVYALSQEIMAELQAGTAVTTLHLQAFLHKHPVPGLDAEALRELILDRGGLVLESPLQDSPAVAAIDPLNEYTMRYHWLHYFYAEALALWPDHPGLAHHVGQNAFVELSRHQAPSDPVLIALLRQLFGPIAKEYALLTAQALKAGRLPVKAREIVLARPDAFLPYVDEVLRALQQRELLVPDAEGRELVPGPRWSELESFAQACRWEESRLKV